MCALFLRKVKTKSYFPITSFPADIILLMAINKNRICQQWKALWRRHTSLWSRYVSSWSRYASLQSSTLRREVGTPHSEVGTLHREVDTLHREVDTFHNEVGTLHREVDALHREVDTLHNEVGTLHREVGTLQHCRRNLPLGSTTVYLSIAYLFFGGHNSKTYLNYQNKTHWIQLRPLQYQRPFRQSVLRRWTCWKIQFQLQSLSCRREFNPIKEQSCLRKTNVRTTTIRFHHFIAIFFWCHSDSEQTNMRTTFEMQRLIHLKNFAV